MAQIDRLALGVRARVDDEHPAARRGGEHGADGGAGDAADAPDAKERAREHRARGTGRYETLHFLVLFEEFERHDEGGILLLADGEGGRVIVGDDLGAVYDFQPRLVVCKAGEIRFYLCFVAR